MSDENAATINNMLSGASVSNISDHQEYTADSAEQCNLNDDEILSSSEEGTLIGEAKGDSSEPVRSFIPLVRPSNNKPFTLGDVDGDCNSTLSSRSQFSKFLLRGTSHMSISMSSISNNSKRRHSNPLPKHQGMCIMCLTGLNGCRCASMVRNSNPFIDTSFAANAEEKQNFSNLPDEVIAAELLMQREKSGMAYASDFFLQLENIEDYCDLKNDFMLTYRYFMTPVELFCFIFQYYQLVQLSSQAPQNDEEVDATIRLKLGRVLSSAIDGGVDRKITEMLSFPSFCRSKIRSQTTDEGHFFLFQQKQADKSIHNNKDASDDHTTVRIVFSNDSGIGSDNDTLRNRVIFHLIILIKNWLSDYCYDFNGDSGMALLRSIRLFLSEDAAQDMALSGIVPSLLRIIDDKIAGTTVKDRRLTFDPTKWDPQLVAEQLAIVDWDLFKSITPPEITRQAWTKKATKKLQSPNVLAMIARFNQVAYWVASLIVSEQSQSDRVHIIEHFIIIIYHCVTLRCFNTAMEVFTGLNMSCVQRLKRTWSKLSDDFVTVWKALRDLLTPRMNYSSLRKHIEELDEKDRFMPYVGVVLADLVRIEETQSDFLSHNRINSKKFGQIAVAMRQLQTDQNQRMDLDEIPILKEEVLRNLFILDEDRLYQESLSCESPSRTGYDDTGEDASKDPHSLRSRLRHMLHRKSVNSLLKERRNSAPKLTPDAPSVTTYAPLGRLSAGDNKRNKRAATLSLKNSNSEILEAYRKTSMTANGVRDGEHSNGKINLKKRASIAVSSFEEMGMDGKRTFSVRSSSGVLEEGTVPSRSIGKRASIALSALFFDDSNSNRNSLRKQSISKDISEGDSSAAKIVAPHNDNDIDIMSEKALRKELSYEHEHEKKGSWGGRAKSKLYRTLKGSSSRQKQNISTMQSHFDAPKLNN